METLDLIITILIVLLIAFIIYTKLKNQDLRDTWEEVTTLVKPKKE